MIKKDIFHSKKYPVFLSFTLLLIYLVINILIIRLIGVFGWDDGAITLAFGKTLGEHGHYSINASSEIVEGSSSNLLVFLTAVINRIFHFDFYQIIRWSQYNALLFTIGSLTLTLIRLKSIVQNGIYLSCTVFLLGFFPPFVNEMMNGMEMTMFAFFLILLVFSYEKQSKYIFVLIPLLLLLRYESVLYLALTFFCLLFFDKNHRRYCVSILWSLFGIFVLFSCFRYYYFGEWVPNTISAKQFYPYVPRTILGRLYSKVMGGVYFFKIFNVLIIAIVLLLYIKKNLSKELGNIKLVMLISFSIGAFIFGFNWGYEGRMFMAVFPVLVIYFFELFFKTNFHYKIKRMFESKKMTASIIIIFCLLLNYPLYAYTYNLLVNAQYLESRKTHYDTSYCNLNDSNFGVTPYNYRITGLAIDHFRQIVNKKIILVMVPDVGGFALSSDKINIIDIALLTNQYLANNGYSKFENFLQITRPDVIEIHDIWSEVTNIFKSRYFFENYSPIVFENNFFWVRKDLLFELTQNNKTKVQIESNKNIPPRVRYYKENEKLLPDNFKVFLFKDGCSHISF